LITKNLVQRGGVVLHSFCDPKTLLTLIERFRTIEPVRSLVVVLEDIDAIIAQYGEHTLLSVLDGESQVDHIVFVATTNYPERLDPRIINRPSRFDRIVKIDMPDAAARKLYLEKKVGTTTSPDGIDLVKSTSGFSIAHLRELIVGIHCLGNSTASVLERLKKMQLVPKPLTTAQEGIGFSVGPDV
jgi:SpoVK/Ycf46/Vps4 family AAA+-type ATPase